MNNPDSSEREPVLVELSTAIQRARASQPYKDHLHALSEARRAANRARVNYENAKAWVDMKRTNASTERALATMR